MDRHFLVVARALTAANQPETAFQAMAGALLHSPGYRLMTALIHDPAAKLIRRAWTNLPDHYPVGGTKPIEDTPWSRQVLCEGVPYVGRDENDIKSVFFDHEILKSLGCASVLNLPVRWNGNVIGSFNILDKANHYNNVEISDFLPLVQLMVPAFLQAQCDV